MSAAPYLFGMAAGALAAPAVLMVLSCVGARGWNAVELAEGHIRTTLAPLRRASAAGIGPTAAERFRLRVLGAVAGGVAASFVAGATLVLPAAVGGAFVLPRIALARRARYGRRVEAGAGAAALSIAGALAGGGAIRAALASAADELEGPISVELRRTAIELESGALVDAALDGLVTRAPSTSLRLIAAAIQLQRRSGGDLAALLRRIAATLEDERQAVAEASAATAQARLTAVMVIALPPVGIVLMELALPGSIGRIIGSPAGVSLLAGAAVLQGLGFAAVRRIGRVAH